MEHKVALVTGGASGIGKEIVCRLAADGFFVIVADRDEAGSAELVGLLNTGSLKSASLPADIGSATDISDLFVKIEATYGRCDVLVNNAGIAKTYPFLDFPQDNWQLTMDINLTGALLMAQKAAVFMIKQNWGRIINMASAAGIKAGKGRTAYGTSKAALIGLTRQMAIELAPYGITANSISPGPIDTPLVARLHSSLTRETYTNLVPMKRYGRPEEVAALVSFLASESASYITGAMIPVDGGFVAAGLLEI